MTDYILLIDIATADAIVAQTPAPITAASWVPAAYIAGGTPAPTLFSILPAVDSVNLKWTPATGNVITVIERAPDVAGSPGAYTEIWRGSAREQSVPAIAGTLFWYRVATVKNGIYSAYSAALSAIAKALADTIGGSGVNILPDNYSVFIAATLPPLLPNAGVVTVARDASVLLLDKPSLKITRIAAGDAYVFLSNGTPNIPVVPSKKYIVSAFVKADAASVSLRLLIGSSGGNISAVVTTSATTNTVTRVSAVLDTATLAAVGNANVLHMLITADGSAVSGSVWHGALMIEEQVGNLTAPSNYARGTAADGTIAAQATANGATAAGLATQGCLAYGDNLIGNGNFESNLIGITQNVWKTAAPSDMADGWTIYQNNFSTTSGALIEENSALGGKSLLLGNFGSPLTIASNGAYIISAAQVKNKIPVKPGEQHRVSYRLRTDYNEGRQGCNFYSVVGLRYFDKDANFLGNPSYQTTNAAGDVGTINVVEIAPANTVYAIPYVLMYMDNFTGSSKTFTGVPLHMRFKNIEVKRMVNLDEQVIDGAIHGRIAMEDTYFTGGRNRNGLRFGNSGHQLGSQRNLRPVTIAGVSSRITGLTASAAYSADTPAVVTFTLSAFTLVFGSDTANYSSSSASVNQTRNTTVIYRLYFLDLNFAGGSRTLNVTTDGINLTNSDGIVWINSISVTVPAAATGGGGDPPVDPCVADEMWIDEFGRAKDLQVGEFIECAQDDSEATEPMLQKVQHNITGVPALCTRIVSESGAAVVASDKTPMDLRDRSGALITEMLDKQVLVCELIDDVELLRWEKCVRCYPVSYEGFDEFGLAIFIECWDDSRKPTPVSKVSLSNNSYFAGEDPRLRIATHNIDQKP